MRYTDPDGMWITDEYGNQFTTDFGDISDILNTVVNPILQSQQQQLQDPERTYVMNAGVGDVDMGDGRDGDGNDGPGDPKKKKANQGGHNGNDLDPSTVGHNWLWSVYIGPNNPISYDRKRWDYSAAPSGLTDLAAYIHDKDYDRLHISGPSGVFMETKAIGADYKLIGSSLDVFANPYGIASPADRLKGLTVGLGYFLGNPSQSFSISCHTRSKVDACKRISWIIISN